MKNQKAMFLKNNQVLVTVPRKVVRDLKIVRGDGINFIPGIDINGKPTYCIIVTRDAFEVKEK